MSSSKQRVAQVRNPTLPAQTTPEQRYWRGYVNPQLVKENHPITKIHFNPVSPNDFAVTSSTRIQVFSSKTRQVVKTFSRFKDTVYSGEYRYDGKLLVASDATGLVSIYDAYQPRNLLVSLNPSTHSTHVAKFHSTIGNQLVTGSDDRIVRLYDISQTTKGPIIELRDNYHGDYIRSASFIPGNPNLIATGCYDGIVRVFDTRQSSSNNQQLIAQFNQQNPVEDVLAISPTTLVSAGGPQVKIWDLARGSQIHELNNFTKTATTLHDTGDKGLLVGSLDGHVKIFDYTTSNWDVKFGWKFGSGGVLSCGVSPASNNHKHFVTGLTSGLITIRTRKTEPKVPQGIKQEKSNAYSRMMRGRDYAGEEEHRSVSSSVQTKKLKQFERHLNGFRWSEALDSAFVPGVSKEQTVTVLNELKKRGKIRISVYGRDEISLLPILQWFTKNLEDVRSINLYCDYIGVILEMYGPLIDKSVVLEECFANLLKKISIEIRKCKDANEIGGMLELLTV
ncbi:WD40 repeat-like protein [Suhomyces tanzawaensis NRRL Y-17324]|uniref:WD40 repeat-like protein n=1 Tax=Suhomyces tanzawaensis NRRL Y-17324 TaxID=984487 RepID=A0A1E4SS81_9ASCO|nr:WD40 repeat-like protein [Suhomyces tanzawaensis NRRL Y-17324]ODV82379.1 WD40 repeat-like protein [Suhomyces tanzawaensis NRRL Y-17324]